MEHRANSILKIKLIVTWDVLKLSIKLHRPFERPDG